MKAFREDGCIVDIKWCKRCEKIKDHSEFWIHNKENDGLQRHCKECGREMKKKKQCVDAENSCSTSSNDMEPPSKRHTSPNWLYIMSYNFDLNGSQFGFKIGRAHDVDDRAKTLSASHAFQLVVHHRFYESGHLEQRLHEMFANHRVLNGSGREWFSVNLDDIVRAVLDLRKASP